MKEKCNGKQWDTCQVEKMGCDGCYYEDISNAPKETKEKK